MKIAGISSNIIADNNEGYVTNKNLYNDKEIADEGDLDWYDYGFRNYDAQTGRFIQMDPLTDNLSDLSPYHYAYNDPVGNTDFNGLIPCPGTSALTIFLEKSGEAISHAFSAIGPIENALSIADHIAGTTSLIMSATVLSQQINNWNTTEVGEQFIDADGMSQYGYADEKGEDDIINVNTKTKEVQVTKTDDNFDIVSVDGAKPVKAEKGVTEALYKSKGSYNISHLYAVGMNAVDNAIIALIGAKFTSWLFRGIAGLFARNAVEEVTNLTMRSDIILSGGRSGQLVKNLTGPVNSVLKGNGNRIFITDDAGKVIWDITKDRAKSVIPGQGFGPKVVPTQQQLDLLNKIWGN